MTVLSAYEIKQGTIEQAEAEKEWVLAHYSRTAKKQRLLSSTGSEPGEDFTKRQKR
jgi:U3 small nucleolar ribonucleoprotein protein IMP4